MGNQILKKIKQDKLNLDQLFILTCIYNDLDALLIEFTNNFEDDRIMGYITGLVRKQFISFNEITSNYSITQDGKEYYEFLLALNDKRRDVGLKTTGIAKGIRKEGFEEWWSIYPSNAKWTDVNSGVQFSDMRPLKSAKEQCRKKYDNLINSGKITHIELMDCLRFEIKTRKIDSLRKNQNQLCFMKNSLSYLNQEAYIAYIDEIKNNNLNCQDCDDIHHTDVYESNSELGYE